MHTSTILTSLLPLSSLALALPLESRDAPEFTLTSLSATFPYPGVYGVDEVDSFVDISLTYPDSSSANGATLTTTCGVNWPKGTTPGPTAVSNATCHFLPISSHLEKTTCYSHCVVLQFLLLRGH